MTTQKHKKDEASSIPWEYWQKRLIVEFRDRPEMIRAVRIRRDKQNFRQLCEHPQIHSSGNRLQVMTRNGEVMAYPGDWIIEGVEKEVYPCDTLIFQKTYESA